MTRTGESANRSIGDSRSSRSPIPRSPDSPLRAWARLLRLPNLLTVPGDPLAGYLLAAGAAAQPGGLLLLLVGASLCLYAGGLILNDLADLTVDRQERPDRPLPSGAVSVTAARRLALALMLGGLGLALPVGLLSFTVAAVLAASVFSYNLWTKSNVLLGPTNMALCRCLSLVLGASVVGHATRALLAAAIGLAVYIASVSYLARRETQRGRTGWGRWLPALTVLGLTVALERFSTAEGPLAQRMGATLFFTFAVAALGAWQAPDRRQLPRSIGLMLSALLGLQGAFCLAANAGLWSVACGLGLLLLWPFHRLLAMRVAAS